MRAIATSSVSPKLSEPLGLFGGTFDPVHYGHLRLAEEAIAHLGLAGVRWIPAGQPPHRGQPQVTAQQRLDMVLRSIEKNARFSLDTSEVEAAAPSYTVHTLERLRGELGGEPVQQFGVRRAAAVEPEVARRLDETGAEVVVPDAVRHDAGEQRVRRRRDPLGELLAAIAVGRVRLQVELEREQHG